MAKLSEIYKAIYDYIETNGDKEVISIATWCGSAPEEYTFNLHDISQTGTACCTGEYKLDILKERSRNPLTAGLGAVQNRQRVFVTQKDVSVLLGCGANEAYDIIREVNESAKKNGNHPFPAGKANKYLFSDIFDIPIEEVDRVIKFS